MTTVEKYQTVLVVHVIGLVIKIIIAAQIFKSDVRIVSISFHWCSHYNIFIIFIHKIN